MTCYPNPYTAPRGAVKFSTSLLKLAFRLVLGMFGDFLTCAIKMGEVSVFSFQDWERWSVRRFAGKGENIVPLLYFMFNNEKKKVFILFLCNYDIFVIGC